MSILEQEVRELVIIGSGPAGYTAAIYAARAKLEPLLYEGFFSGPAGGQLMTTTDVENFPAFPQGVMGPDLMDKMRAQAQRFGTTLITQDVEEVDLSCYPFRVLAKKELRAKAIIIASGASAKRLDVPGTREGELWQKGVSACAVCDGAMPIFRDQPLFVVGGGDSAAEEALFLTKYGSSVTVLHRRDTLRASKIMADRLLSHPKVRVLFLSQLKEVRGKELVSSVVVELQEGGKTRLEELPAAGVFFAIGHTPSTRFLKEQLELDEAGYIITKSGSTATSVPGVFAAGDVQDAHYRQAVTAAGTGCMAALDAERFLSSRSS